MPPMPMTIAHVPLPLPLPLPLPRPSPPPPRCSNILFAVGSCVPTIAQDRRGSGSCLNRSSSIASRSTTDSPAPRRSSHATLGRASEEEEEDADDSRREEKNRRGGLGGAASAAVAVATISSGRDDNIVDLLLLLLSRPPPAAVGLVVGYDPPIEWEEIVGVRTATMRGAHRNSSTVVGSDTILIMLPPLPPTYLPPTDMVEMMYVRQYDSNENWREKWAHGTRTSHGSIAFHGASTNRAAAGRKAVQ